MEKLKPKMRNCNGLFLTLRFRLAFMTLSVLVSFHQVESSPTDPLTIAEIELAKKLVFKDNVYIVTTSLLEPPKAVLKKFLDQLRNANNRRTIDQIAHARDTAIPRKAIVVIIDRKSGRSSEIIVNLSKGIIESKKELAEGTQPMISAADTILGQKILKEDKEVQRRVAEQGLTMDMIVFSTWRSVATRCADHPEFCGRRLSQSFVYFKEFPQDNIYAHPLNFLPIVDLLAEVVLTIEDLPIYDNYTRSAKGKIDLPHKTANYDPRLFSQDFFRKIHPLSIKSAEGPSFKITEGYQVDWQGFQMRIGFNVREGVTLNDVSYKERNKPRRSLLYRVAFSELVVPYSDPRPPYARKMPLDIGEFGLAFAINSLTAGAECVEQSHLIDVTINDEEGNPVVIPNGICISEIDDGILHRHSGDTVTMARGQNLVIMFMITAANYDYAFYYIFKQDGTITLEVGMTGIMFTALLMKNTLPWASLMMDKVMAPYHQHIFCVRLDTSFDGETNRVLTMDLEPIPLHPITNPFGNGFVDKETLLTTSLNSVTDASLEKNRAWKIVNPNSMNSVTGTMRGYKLLTNNLPLAYANNQSLVVRRAGVAKHSTWVVQYHEDELYAAGKYPNQNENPRDGVANWVKRNEPIVDKDIVLFHSFAFSHVPRMDEWPLMGMEKTSISLKPCNFFDGYLGLDVPPPPGFIQKQDQLAKNIKKN